MLKQIQKPDRCWRIGEGTEKATDPEPRPTRQRLWVDGFIAPAESRAALRTTVAVATRYDDGRAFRTGELQV